MSISLVTTSFLNFFPYVYIYVYKIKRLHAQIYDTTSAQMISIIFLCSSIVEGAVTLNFAPLGKSTSFSLGKFGISAI